MEKASTDSHRCVASALSHICEDPVTPHEQVLMFEAKPGNVFPVHPQIPRGVLLRIIFFGNC
jgi:hypothetical protein